MFKTIGKLFSFNNKNGAFQVSSFGTKTTSKPKKFLKAFLYLEVGAFIGSYLLWRQMNHSQDFRYYLSKNFPPLLEGYYQIGEQIGNLQIRKYDQEAWKNKEK